jgi:hypothetical protein
MNSKRRGTCDATAKKGTSMMSGTGRQAESISAGYASKAMQYAGLQSDQRASVDIGAGQIGGRAR